jgi:adenosylcobinamide-phosphate synthase
VDTSLLLTLFEQPASLLGLALLLEWLLPLPTSVKPSAVLPLLERLSLKVNRRGSPATQQWLAGLLTPLTVLFPVLLGQWALRNLSLSEALFDLVLLLWLIEWRPLKNESRGLQQLIRGNKLNMARLQLARWTRRDTARLSLMGVCKAASEMTILRWLGQWFGVGFWFLVAGIEGALTFRLLQLMAQAFTPKLPRNLLFGEFCCRLYRLSLLLPGWFATLLLGAFPGGGHALLAAFRQAKGWHSSGSGALLAAMAAGLGISLGGPRFYLEQKIRYVRLGGPQEPDLQAFTRVHQRLTALSMLLLVLLFGFEGIAFYAQHLR